MSAESRTEVGRFEFGKDGRVVLSRSAQPITYYKRHWFTWIWVACGVSDRKGCAVIRRATLSLDRPPPPLRDQPPPPKPEEAPKKAPPTKAERQRAQLETVLDVIEGVHHWWTKPMPSLLPPAAPKPVPAPEPASAEPVIPPFDIQQIPDVMDKLRLPVAASMMRHWFAGEANYSVTEDDLKAGIDQSGKPYRPSMIDQSIIDLDWVLGFPRAKTAYDELISTAIYAPNARDIIKKKLLAYMECRANPFVSMNGNKASGLDVHRLHKDFQFQRVGVDATLLEKSIQWLAGDAGMVRAPDDLTGALGSFSFYAAIGDVDFNPFSRIARVDSIYVYVRDSYSFRDEDPSVSQYLGHWNESGVYLAPLPVVYLDGVKSWISAPLADINKSIYEKGAVMYPVSNQSFRDWRAKHVQGGDFIAYTQVRKIRLTKDIYVGLK